MRRGEAFGAALIGIAISVVIAVLTMHWGIPSTEQVTNRALVTVRDQAAKAGVYDASFNPGFNAAITGAKLADFIKTVLEILTAIATIITVIARKIM